MNASGELRQQLIRDGVSDKRYSKFCDVGGGSSSCAVPDISNGAKFALVAVTQIAAWTWILYAVVPALRGPGGSWIFSSSSELQLQGIGGATVVMPPPEDVDGSLAVKLWADERHVLIVELGRDGAGGATIVTGLGFRYIDGTLVRVAVVDSGAGDRGAGLTVQVDGLALPGDGYRVAAFEHEKDGVTLTFAQPPQGRQFVHINTTRGLDIRVMNAPGSRGMDVAVAVHQQLLEPVADPQLQPEGLLRHVLPSTGAIDGPLAATITASRAMAGAGRRGGSSTVDGTVPLDAVVGLYAVPDLFGAHTQFNRLSVQEPQAGGSA